LNACMHLTMSFPRRPFHCSNKPYKEATIK
jgi:hypothetical protein